MTEQKTIGQIAYEAWFGDLSLKDGKTPMDWPGDMHKDEWEAAASAVWDQAVEACFMVVREGVEWKPEENFSDKWRNASRETSYRLSDALRSLKRSEEKTERNDG